MLNVMNPQMLFSYQNPLLTFLMQCRSLTYCWSTSVQRTRYNLTTRDGPRKSNIPVNLRLHQIVRTLLYLFTQSSCNSNPPGKTSQNCCTRRKQFRGYENIIDRCTEVRAITLDARKLGFVLHFKDDIIKVAHNNLNLVHAEE